MKAEIIDRARNLGARIDYLPLVGYSAFLGDLPPLLAAEPLPPFSTPEEIRARIHDIEYERTIRFRRTLDTPSPVRGFIPRNVANILEGVSARIPARIRVAIDGQEVARLPVAILPLSEWTHLPETRKLAAAYVVPGDDAVFRTVVDASSALDEVSKGQTLPEIVRAGSDGAPQVALEALYKHLSSACEIEYEEPIIDVDPDVRATHQTVRAAHELVGSSSTMRGKGNCLDLSLLFSSCLESLGLNPLVFFTGALEESPSHAFVGCWSDSGRRFRPILTDSSMLQSKIERGELLVVEATGVCTKGHRLEYDAAVATARARFEGTAKVHALDVVAARPPHGDVRPLKLSNSAVVQQAYWAAEKLRERLGAPARETLHVLYGLCVVGNELTGRLLEAAGGTASRVCRIIEASLPKESHTGPGQETNNYRVCVETARLNARNRDSSAVDEADVLWAVLESPSRNVRKVLEAAGCDCAVVFAQLSREWRRPREVTVSRTFNPASTGSR